MTLNGVDTIAVTEMHHAWTKQTFIIMINREGILI